MTHIALATCSNLPDWEVDDAPLHRALEELGVQVSHPAWDDPKVDWDSFDACLIRTTWDYMHKFDAFVKWAEDVGSRIPLFNPVQTVRWNTHKSYLKDLERRGVPVIPTVWIAPGEKIDVQARVNELGWTKAFLKPAIGASAVGTLPFNTDADGCETARIHLEEQGGDCEFLMQPYLSSVETYGEVSAIYFGGVYSHGVRKIPVPGDYRVQDDYGATDEPWTPTIEELGLTDSIFNAVDVPMLYARIDLLRDDGGNLVLTELEVVEPSLFFRHHEPAASALAQVLLRSMRPPTDEETSNAASSMSSSPSS